jgi:hypothetical protein
VYDRASEARASITREYEIDARGRIVNPGRFESEFVFVPWFYNMVLDGAGEFVNDHGNIVRLDVTEYDRLAFPELGDAVSIEIGDDDNGFVFAIVGWRKDDSTPLMF